MSETDVMTLIEARARMMQIVEKVAKKKDLTHSDVSILIEDILDTLIEVGNGTTDEMLHQCATYLFAIRDQWFKKLPTTQEIKDE